MLGQERYYQVSSTGIAGVNLEALAARVSPQGQPTKGKMLEHRFEVSARLGMRVLAQVGDEFLVAMRLENPRYLVDGTPDTRASVLETPFVVRVTRRGEMRAFEFPVKYPDEAKVAIRALVEPLQVVFVDTASDSWTVGEKNANGSATVDYRLTSVDSSAQTAHLTRTVTAARRALPGTTSPSDRSQFQTRIDSSKGTIEWALDGSGLKKLEITEATTSFSGRQELAKSDTTFSATLVTTPVAGLPKTAAEAQTKLKDTTLARASFYRVPPSFEQQLSGVDFDTALGFYMQRIGPATAETTLLMKFYLRKNPQDARAFADALNDASKAERTEALENVVGYGFAAMAAAGHTEAQRVLVDVISQPGWTDLCQEKALDAMLSLEMPERFVPPAVWAVRAKLPTRGSNVDVEKLSIATNIYGAMGNVTLGVHENTNEVVKTLGELLKSADPYEQARALVAFGNIGDPALVLPHTDRFFRSKDEGLRSRAFDGFRHAETDAHFARFVELYNSEQSGWVRREASLVAMTMADSPRKNAWAVEQARTSTDGIIQGRAVTMLGRALEKHPENEQALRGLLETVKDREVRKVIYSFVAPKPRGAK